MSLQTSFCFSARDLVDVFVYALGFVPRKKMFIKHGFSGYTAYFRVSLLWWFIATQITCKFAVGQSKGFVMVISPFQLNDFNAGIETKLLMWFSAKSCLSRLKWNHLFWNHIDKYVGKIFFFFAILQPYKSPFLILALY